jgi:hypothetical protein
VRVCLKEVVGCQDIRIWIWVKKEKGGTSVLLFFLWYDEVTEVVLVGLWMEIVWLRFSLVKSLDYLDGFCMAYKNSLTFH